MKDKYYYEQLKLAQEVQGKAFYRALLLGLWWRAVKEIGTIIFVLAALWYIISVH